MAQAYGTRHGKLIAPPVCLDPKTSGLRFAIDDGVNKWPFQGQSSRLAATMSVLLLQAWAKEERIVVEYMDDDKVATGAGVPDGTFFMPPSEAAPLPTSIAGTVYSYAVWGRDGGVLLQTSIDDPTHLFFGRAQEKVVEFTSVLAQARFFNWSVEIVSHLEPNANYPDIDSIKFKL